MNENSKNLNSIFGAGTRIYVLKDIYPSECVLKAAYTFLDKVYVHVDEDNKHWVVDLEAKSNYEFGERQLEKDFENELVAQAVRLSVFKRTHTLREILLARAMSSSLIDSEDPLIKVDVEDEAVSNDQLQHILKDWCERHEE